MPQNRPPQRHSNPVNPTFFLQERHRLFFFFSGLGGSSSSLPSWTSSTGLLSTVTGADASSGSGTSGVCSVGMGDVDGGEMEEEACVNNASAMSCVETARSNEVVEEEKEAGAEARVVVDCFSL